MEVRGEESRGGTTVTMGYNSTFAELMMERIKAIDKDWQKPWIEKGSFMMPRNLSGRPYNGINTFLLLLYSAKQKFDMPVFVTHNQIAYDLNNKSKLKEDKTEKPAVDLNPTEGENPHHAQRV